jgi:dGTPase
LNHDIDDGLRAGLFETEALFDVPLVGPILRGVDAAHPSLERGRLIGEAVRRLISAMVADLVAETGRRLTRAAPRSAADIRGHDLSIAAFSDSMRNELGALKGFLFERMYRHQRVLQVMQKAQVALSELFAAFMAEPALLPKDWLVHTSGNRATARAVCDYIAGMTDRYVLQEYRRIFHMEFQL